MDIVLREGNKMITNDIEKAEIFNDQYINIIEKFTGTAPTTLRSINKLEKENINLILKISLISTKITLQFLK